jgi:hypothetical protein
VSDGSAGLGGKSAKWPRKASVSTPEDCAKKGEMGCELFFSFRLGSNLDWGFRVCQ